MNYGGHKIMRICENGIYRDMTAEEIAALDVEQTTQAVATPSIEERLSAVEAALLEEVLSND